MRGMRTLRSLLALVFTAGAMIAPCQWGHASVLHPMESELASLCYLFQGLPTGVMGVTFTYETQEAQECEKYLAKLLDTTKPYQKELREAAAFLASRTYMDEKGGRFF